MAVMAPEYRLRCCCLLVRSLFKCSAVNKSLFCVAAPYELKATKTYANRTILMLLVSICMRTNFTMFGQHWILNAFVHPVDVCVCEWGEVFGWKVYWILVLLLLWRWYQNYADVEMVVLKQLFSCWQRRCASWPSPCLCMHRTENNEIASMQMPRIYILQLNAISISLSS